MTLVLSFATVESVQQPASNVQVTLWLRCAMAAAGVVGLAGVAGADGAAGRLEVAALTAVTVAGFVAHSRWPRMPSVVLGAWTFAPAVVLNLRERGEGTMFLLVVALSFVVLVTPDRRVARRRRTGGGVGAPVGPAARDLPDLVASMVSTGSQVDLDIVGDIEEVEPVRLHWRDVKRLWAGRRRGIGTREPLALLGQVERPVVVPSIVGPCARSLRAPEVARLYRRARTVYP